MTKIQWTEDTWNPIVGCTIATPGCTNCYAMNAAWRMGHNPKTPQYHGLTKKVNGNAVWTGKMNLVENVLTQPLKRRKPTMYFVNSMGDLFHENVPNEWIDKVFAVMALCPQHTFQVLTKRADRMRECMRNNELKTRTIHALKAIDDKTPSSFNSRDPNNAISWNAWAASENLAAGEGKPQWPLANVWLGVSVEDQTRAHERIPLLLDTPAAVRFVSAEPLLGPVDISAWVHNPVCRAFDSTQCTCDQDDVYPELDWVIVGGESGPKARPMHPDWARSLRDQCVAAGVPFFFKQWGNSCPGSDLNYDKTTFCMDKQARCVSAPARSGDFPNGASSSDGWAWMRRVGTKAAGNLLDGAEWQQMPEVGA